jgi:hypothetical protein
MYFTFGIKKKNIIYGNALNDSECLIYVGSKTGEEGIYGAAMASKSFSKNDKIDESIFFYLHLVNIFDSNYYYITSSFYIGS